MFLRIILEIKKKLKVNQLGAVALVDTHGRYCQDIVQNKKKAGNVSLQSRFVTISVDNIDYLQSHAAVYSGDQHQHCTSPDSSSESILTNSKESGLTVYATQSLTEPSITTQASHTVQTTRSHTKPSAAVQAARSPVLMYKANAADPSNTTLTMQIPTEPQHHCTGHHLPHVFE